MSKNRAHVSMREIKERDHRTTPQEEDAARWRQRGRHAGYKHSCEQTPNREAGTEERNRGLACDELMPYSHSKMLIIMERCLRDEWYVEPNVKEGEMCCQRSFTLCPHHVFWSWKYDDVSHHGRPCLKIHKKAVRFRGPVSLAQSVPVKFLFSQIKAFL
ncbi:hypothetical protein NDU88_006878 [Pleurodeles waltl]|uniref:Uncharacterized protein n=1 Tax=Pleurodeles waltl TaxID=8319 RepID=A0AAV7QM18_PLEWA|nr:hypothetical protein NDU88_006878 [Pleurodeles waltl]